MPSARMPTVATTNPGAARSERTAERRSEKRELTSLAPKGGERVDASGPQSRDEGRRRGDREEQDGGSGQRGGVGRGDVVEEPGEEPAECERAGEPGRDPHGREG